MTSLLVQEMLRRGRQGCSPSFLTRLQRFRTSSVQQSKRKEKVPVTDPVSNKLESFLAQIESTKHNASLRDIEKFKPYKIPRLGTPEYETAYNELTSTLFKSFSIHQFMTFFRDSELPLPRRKTKKELISVFVEKRWGWSPVSRNREERRKQTEVLEHNFPMTTEQSLLLMGKDGSNLLRISQQYNVHLAFTYHPLSLKVEGRKSSLDECKSYMEQFYNDIRSEYIPIAPRADISDDMLLDIAQSISRTTGAHVSVEEDNRCKITYLQSSMTALEDARYLLQNRLTQVHPNSLMASVQKMDVSDDSFISSSYSLYPFSSSHPLPWQAQSKSTFRLRRVGQWLSASRSSEAETIDLTQASSSSRRVVDIKGELLSRFSVNHRPRISALSGHILFLSSASMTSRLVPPLKGSVDFSTALRWSDNHPGSTIFLHSSPFNLLSGGADQSRCHKAIYITQVSASQLQHEASSTPPTQCLIFETKEGSNDVSIKSRSESFVDVVLPERAYDLRLTASYEEAVDIPNNIVDAIVSRMSDNQRPALSFEHESTTYILNSYSNASRQMGGPHVSAPIRVPKIEGSPNTEEVLDVTTGHKYIMSELVCQDPTDENMWSNFLTGCAYLTGTRSKH